MADFPAGKNAASNTDVIDLQISSSPDLNFVGDPKFHQVLRCPRTNMNVSFSEAGLPDGPVILFCLPSGCSRYVGGPSFEDRANRFGVRVVAIDRPGTGGTERCDLGNRIHISTEHAVSVLEHLKVSRVSALLGHSAGAIYALHFLRSFPELLLPNPRLYLTSPWVPTSASSMWLLTLLPSPPITNQHVLMPSVLPTLNTLGNALAFSTNLFKRAEDSKWTFPERLRPDDGSPYRPQPPYHEVGGPNNAASNAIMRVALMEPLQGCSQEYLLSLERGGEFRKTWYAKAVSEVAEQYAARGQKVHVEVWWGAKDKLVPRKGRKWFDELMRKPEGGIEYTSFELSGAGHDNPLGYAEVIPSIFEEVRDNAQQSAKAPRME